MEVAADGEDEWSPSQRDIIATRTWFDLKKRMRPPLRAETMLLWSDMMLMDRGLGRYVPFDSGLKRSNNVKQQVPS
jgi:hypothetical protein